MTKINEIGMDDWEAAQYKRSMKKANKPQDKDATKKKLKIGNMQKQFNSNLSEPEYEDSIKSIIEDLKTRFLVNGKEVPNNDSIKRMQQFLRFTDTEYAKKNISGGAIFTDANRFGKNKDEFANVFANIHKLRVPAMEIAYILKNTKSFDTHHLEDLKYKILDLCETMPLAVHEIMHDPAVVKAIQDKIPFWVGGSTAGGGHNVGFRDILKQFNKDMKNQVYQQIAGRIDDFINKGKDPLSYKDRFVSESRLKQLIKESIIRTLNEGATDNETIDKWYQVQDAIGPQQMLDCIFQWSSSDQIEQWLQWFEDEEWISFDNNEDEEY